MARNQAREQEGEDAEDLEPQAGPLPPGHGLPQHGAPRHGEQHGDGPGQAGVTEEADDDEATEAAEQDPMHPVRAVTVPASPHQSDQLLDGEQDGRQAEHQQQGQGDDVRADRPAG